jgi:tetrapyrrole methylase family protein / MazG family protein
MGNFSPGLRLSLSAVACRLACCRGAGRVPVSPRRKKSRKIKAAVRDTSRGGGRLHISLSPRDRQAGKWFERLVALQARLRGPGGCPWDREQTHESLRKFLLEETYEVLDAMESGDAREFSGELGDLLLQVVFHSILAEESGRFTISDVIESIYDKMVRRHPHVFGKVRAPTSKHVLKNWEQLKAAERAVKKSPGAGTQPGADSILAGVPRSLPALLEADQLTRRASHIGFDWDDVEGVLEKLQEEAGELRSAAAQQGAASSSSAKVEEEAGDLLFAAMNIARFLGVNPEIALKKANRKFKQRFNWMEAAAAREGRPLADLPRARMEELWDQSKLQAKLESSGSRRSAR